jgi:ADP-heptose:LPS heptosyltransferase
VFGENFRIPTRLKGNTSLNRIAADMIARADAARDARQYRDAALLYDESLRIAPGGAAIHVQCGHMFKETGDLARAEQHYLVANRLTPTDPDLALQLGHFYKVAGRLKDSEANYRRACVLRPGWPEPAIELANLYRIGWRRDAGSTAALITELQSANLHRVADDILRFEDETAEIARASAGSKLARELVPRKPESMFHAHQESIEIRRLGRPEPSHWGLLPTLRGVEAIRGFCISAVPILEMQVAINGYTIHRSPMATGHVLNDERENKDLRKYVFNVWFDFSHFVLGCYEVELRFLDLNYATRTRRDRIVVAEPLAVVDFPDSDGLLSLQESDHRSVDEQINGMPSMVRPAKRSLFNKPPRNVLILRTDQLGDMVASVPAMRRMRQLLPGARLVGLLTSANADLARTLDLFDEIIVVEFPDDWLERRRIMPLEAQEDLRRKLAPYQFDLAVDLADSRVSRPLLLLSGARFLFGCYDRDWPWLSAGFEANTHDRLNRMDVAPHSSKVLALVERIGTLLTTSAEAIRRNDLTPAMLVRYGLEEAERFAVLHTGARIEFSRWPHYGALAALILAKTDLKVVMLADDSAVRANLPSDLLRSGRFQLLDTRLSFDDLDALLSFCTIFVGNDSGPKHLASLRGANVVSIHSARVNWNEWGQEITGSIISRKVPCAGCLIYHDAEECGKEFACISRISLEEVFAVVEKYIKQS